MEDLPDTRYFIHVREQRTRSISSKKKDDPRLKAAFEIPKGVRVYIQQRKLSKRIQEAEARCKRLVREHKNLVRDAWQLVGSRREGRRAHVSELGARGTAPPSQHTVSYTSCLSCGGLLEKVVDASVTICPRCGVSEPFLESTRSGLAFNEDVEFVNNTYKRQNHFRSGSTRSSPTAPIPDPVIQKISTALQGRCHKKEDITRTKVRAALKALRLRRYYENISSILCQLTGVKPRRLLKHEENQLKNMFLVIQKPFERHCPKDRSNFLSYSYILFKFCELTGLDWMLGYFKLLKGNDKLHKQDETFRKICEDLNWQFIPSI